MTPEMRHLLFVYVVYNYVEYNGLSYLRVFSQYESYTHELLASGRRRGKGSLEKAQRRAWQAIEFATAGMEKAAESGDDQEVRKWIHCLTQALTVYSKLVIDSDIELRIRQLEQRVSTDV